MNTSSHRALPLLGCIAAGLLAGAGNAQAAGNNDYVANITVTTNVGSSINGLNVDRATGKVYAAFNHSVSVYPAGVGGQAAELTFPIDPDGGSGSSPSGTVFQNNKFFVSAYWRTGTVFSYDAQGQNQQTTFIVNDQVPYTASAPGSVGMTSNSKGDLVLASLNMPNMPPTKTGVIVKGVDGSTRWKVYPSVDPDGDVLQVAVDGQDNVYAAGDGYGKYVQVYDAAGAPLKQIGPVQGEYSAGVAVDRCNFVYISSGSNTVEKFDPAGQKVATLTDTARTYRSNRGSRPVSVDAEGKHIYMINSGSGFYAVWTQTTTAPPAPAVQAAVTAPKAIQVTWNKAAECISAYQLQISPDNGATWIDVALSGVPLERTITPADTTLTAGKTYLLRASSTDADGTSNYGPTASVTLPDAPPLPAPVIGGTGVASPPTINASWNAIQDATGYTLDISADQSNWTSIALSGTQTQYPITASAFPPLVAGQSYYIRVTATNAETSSPPSNVATVAIPDAHTPPQPPVITATGHNQPPRVLAQWNAPATNISSYLLEVNGSSFAKSTAVQITVPGSQTSREITAADVPGMAEGQTYYVRVSATSPDGTSVFSQQASALIPSTPPSGNATPVPTLGEWAMVMLTSLMALLGMRRMRNKNSG